MKVLDNFGLKFVEVEDEAAAVVVDESFCWEEFHQMVVVDVVGHFLQIR